MKICSEKQILSKSGKISGTLHENLSTFYSFRLRMQRNQAVRITEEE
jgi:hypothetical protein